MIKFGSLVKDVVSGLEGIVTARIEYMNGCIQYCIKPKLDKDGKVQEGSWVDDQQIEVLSGTSSVTRKLEESMAGSDKAVTKKFTGGPSTDAPKL